jgi:hypothetical protein
LEDENSKSGQIFKAVTKLINIRTNEESFDPHGSMKTVFIHDAIVSVIVTPVSKNYRLLAIVNVSNKKYSITIEQDTIQSDRIIDLISGRNFQFNKSSKKLEMEFFFRKCYTNRKREKKNSVLWILLSLMINPELNSYKPLLS